MVRLLYAVVLVALLAGCHEKKEESQVRIRAEAVQELTLTTLEDQKLSLSIEPKKVTIKANEKKALLLVFFATWCPPCLAEIPHLSALQQEFGDKLIVVGVNLEEGKTKEELAAFKTQKRVGYLLTYGSENFHLADTLGGVRGFPTMYLFTPQGELAGYYPGAAPEEMLRADIRKAIGQ
ncbi:MAG: TlpA family protein disulfide reductase [Campylobacterales bacterium]